MDKEELKKLISEMEKKAESERRKREAIVIAAFTAVFFLLYCFLEKTPETFGDLIEVFLPSLLFSGLSFGINQAVFEHLFERDEAAQREIRELRKQLSDIQNKEIDEYIKRYTKE